MAGMALLLPSTRAAVVVETALVGDPGNPNSSNGFGAVTNNYWIGKYEVTLNQYSEFLNAVGSTDPSGLLWTVGMETEPAIAGIRRLGADGSYTYAVSGDGNRPVAQASWFRAARFVNWLHNGQPTGGLDSTTTERGAYTLNGARTGVNFSRGADWGYSLPSENEWYKAAYYQPAASGGPAGGYWNYATRNNSKPNSRNGSATDANSANFYWNDGIANGFNGGYAVNNSTVQPATGGLLTPVGAFEIATSYYGTFDQSGNVAEWNDAVVTAGATRGVRGGAWAINGGAEDADMRSDFRGSGNPANGNATTGFRIVARGPMVFPTMTALASQSVDEDTATDAIEFTVADPVSPASSLILAGTSSNTNLVPRANIVFGGSDSNRTVVITPAPNQSGIATITIKVRNSVLFTNQSFQLTVAPVNDAPALSLPNTPATFLEGSPAVAMSPTAVLTDVDSSTLSGGAMTITIVEGGSAEDRLGILNQGAGPGQVAVVGDIVSYQGVSIGTLSGGADGASPLVIALNASATPLAAQALLRSITFSNASEITLPVSRTIRAVVTDGQGGVSAPATALVNLVNVPRNPVIHWTAPAPLRYGVALTAAQLNASASTAGSFSYAPAASAILAAGTRTLSTTFTPADSVNYNSVTGTTTIGVSPADLLVTADNKTRIFGEANPTLTATITGFVNGDTAASLDTPAALSTAATTASAVGTYPIVASGASDANYVVAFANGTLTVLTDDTDGDGIPDAYEVAHGMNKNDPADAALDFDGDRLTNLQEYRAGTDPSDSSSVFRILGVDQVGADVQVRFSSVAGRLYRLERNEQFPAGVWMPAGQVIEGTGGPLSILDPGASALPNAIYRLSVTNVTGVTNVSTEPAGFQKVDLIGNSDTIVALPFVRPEFAAGIVTAVTGNQVQITGAPAWTPGQLAYAAGTQPDTYQLFVRSGTNEGRLYTITNNTANSVTLDLNGSTLSGLAANDRVSILPAWTLATVFPEGNGIFPSPWLIRRPTEVLLPDMDGTGINLSSCKIFCYQPGAWKQIGQGGVSKNDEIIPLNTYLTVRHNVPTNTACVLSGTVLTSKISVPLAVSTTHRQDNFVSLARPSAISLDDSGLAASAAFRTSPSPLNPTDELLVFDNSVPGKNKSASAVYYLLESGWFRVGGSSTPAGTHPVLAPSAAIIIRKSTAPLGVVWNHPSSY